MKEKEIIKRQNELIGELTVKVSFLEDSERRRSEWLTEAKKNAGYSDSVSFDVVWQKALAALKAAKK